MLDDKFDIEQRITAMVKKYATGFDFQDKDFCSLSAKLYALEGTLEGVALANRDWCVAYKMLEDEFRKLGRMFYDKEMLRLSDIDGVEFSRPEYEGGKWESEINEILETNMNAFFNLLKSEYAVRHRDCRQDFNKILAAAKDKRLVVLDGKAGDDGTPVAALCIMNFVEEDAVYEFIPVARMCKTPEDITIL